MTSDTSSHLATAAPCDFDATSGVNRADLLYGVPAIAEHLGISQRQARHLSERRSIPTFRLPGNTMICARRSSLNAWLAEQEAAARKPEPRH